MQIKKLTQKDRHGNMTSIEFEVPPMQDIPHPGGPKGTDTVPAWLTPGENVINAEASRLPGVQPMLDELNDAGRAIQAQQGGPIPTYAAEGKSFGNRISDWYKTRWINDEVLDALRFVESSDRHFKEDGTLLVNPKSGATGAYQWKQSSADSPGFGVEPFNVTTIGEEGMRQKTKEYLQGIQLAHPEWSPKDVIRAFNAGPGTVRKNVRGPDEGSGKLTDFGLTQEAFEYPYKVLGRAGYSEYEEIPSQSPKPESLPLPVPAPMTMKEYEKYMSDVDKMSVGGEVFPSPSYYATGSSANNEDDKDPFYQPILDFFGGNDDDEIVYTPPPGTRNAPPVVTPPANNTQTPTAVTPPVPPAATTVPPVVAPPATVEQPEVPADAGEVGVNDTIIRNGVPYIYDSEKDEYVDAEGREYSRSPGEFIGDIFEGLSRLGEESIGPPADSTLVGKIKNEGIVGPEFYDVYRTENGDFIKVGYGGVRERLSSVMGTEDDIIFIDESQRSTVPPATEGLVPLPDGTPGTTPDTSQGVQTLDDTDDSDIEGAADEGANQDPGAWEKAKTWVADNFGYLKDDKLLARMAVQYFGSRVLGYDHLTSARYAAKDYMTELDEKLDKTPLGIKKRGGRIYHTQLGVLPTVIGTDDIERINVDGQLLRLDNPVVAPYIEDYQESQHDRDNIKKAFRTDGLTYLKEVNANREPEDKVPEALSVRISDEADTLFNTRKFGYGGMGAQQRADLISNLNLAMSEYYRDYAAWIDDGKKKGREPSSLQAYFQKRQINIDTGGAWSNADIEGTDARTFAKIDKQIKDKAWESSNENPKRAMELYQFNMAKYKSTWTKYTAMAAQGKNVPTVFLNAGGEGMNPMMNWINECLSGNKKALEIFKLVKQ